MTDSYVATADAERQCDESRHAVGVENECYSRLSMRRGCLSPVGNRQTHGLTRATSGCRRSADGRQRERSGPSAALPRCHCLQRLTGLPNPPSSHYPRPREESNECSAFLSEFLRIPRPREVPMRDRVLKALDANSPCGQKDVVVDRLAVLVNDNAEDADVGEAGQEVDDISEQPRPDPLISSAA